MFRRIMEASAMVAWAGLRGSPQGTVKPEGEKEEQNVSELKASVWAERWSLTCAHLNLFM